MAILGESRQLKKELSLFDVYTLATGATLSSGLFLLPGLAAAEAGPAVVLSYMLAVVPLLPGILSKLELSTAMPRAGGEYYFLDRSLGPLVGTIGGMGTWCSLVLKTAFALIGIGAYLDLFFPEAPMIVLAAAVAVVLGVVNMLGARKTGRFQVVLVLVLLLLLTWFVATGVSHTRPEHFHNFMASGWDHIVAAAGLVTISYMGLTKVASVAEEVQNPERNLPMGIFLAMGTAIVVYALGTFVIVGVVAPARLHDSLTPVADAAEVLIGHWGAVIMTIAAVLAFLSVGNAGILSASRYPLAMSRDHLLPRWFRKLSAQKTPQNGVIVTVAAVLVLVVVFDPSKIAKLASAFLLLLFTLNNLAVIVMRESKIESYDPGFRAPFYPWTQVFGIIAPLVFIAMMGWLPVLFSAGLIAVGAAWYFYYAQHRVARGGAIYHLFARLGQRRFEGLDRELRGILKEKGLRAQDPYDQVVARADVIDEPASVTFEQIVKRAAKCLAPHVPVSADQLVTGFMEGTRVGATPVTKGVALPHLRLAGIDQPIMVLARTPAGVSIEVEAEFIAHASDQAIYAFIFLVSPEADAAQHLRILAQVAPHVDDEHFIPEWLAARNEQELKEILLRDDRFLSLVLTAEAPSAALIGQQMHDLTLPQDCLIALIRRGSNVIFPRLGTVLHEGDRLTIIGLPQTIRQLKAQYEG